MGLLAADQSDRVVFTSDNPRDEDPQDILREMEEGVTVTDMRKVIVIPDR